MRKLFEDNSERIRKVFEMNFEKIFERKGNTKRIWK